MPSLQIVDNQEKYGHNYEQDVASLPMGITSFIIVSPCSYYLNLVDATMQFQLTCSATCTEVLWPTIN